MMTGIRTPYKKMGGPDIYHERIIARHPGLSLIDGTGTGLWLRPLSIAGTGATLIPNNPNTGSFCQSDKGHFLGRPIGVHRWFENHKFRVFLENNEL
jgi:hypothetical protein